MCNISFISLHTIKQLSIFVKLISLWLTVNKNGCTVVHEPREQAEYRKALVRLATQSHLAESSCYTAYKGVSICDRPMDFLTPTAEGFGRPILLAKLNSAFWLKCFQCRIPYCFIMSTAIHCIQKSNMHFSPYAGWSGSGLWSTLHVHFVNL
jgi:hypothetical protein